MKSETFAEYWMETYPKCPPIGYYLRQTYQDIWFRIHSLPFSKRYADTDKEIQEVLMRHNQILSELLGEDGVYVLLTTTYSESSVPTQNYSPKRLNTLVESSEFLFTFPEKEIDEYESYRHFFIAERSWTKNSSDELLMWVADDAIDNVLFVGVNQSCIYSPYDGGADIFVQDDSRRITLKDKYSDWLSPYPLGL